MTVELYINYSDNNVVGKNLASLGTVSAIVATSMCNVETPVITLERNDNNQSANYCYIPDFGRFYHINRHTLDRAMRDTITCNVDVLQTYAQGIRNLVCTVVRQEHEKPNMITDDYLPLSPEREVRCAVFPIQPFNLATASATSYNFLLNVSGGAGGSEVETNRTE